MTPVGLERKGHCVLRPLPLRDLDTPRFPGCISGTAARKELQKPHLGCSVGENQSVFYRRKRPTAIGEETQVNLEKF